MDKDNENNQNDQSIEEQEPSDETQDELRKIGEDELKQILEDHKKWLESEGKEGKMADLRKANLEKANLQDADFNGANLELTCLKEANLQNAKLEKANLQNADLKLADLRNAKLYYTELKNANLSKANLQKADLNEANLQNSVLNEANLQKANLGGANLQNAYFYKANLQEADLVDANLKQAVINKANMQNTALDGVRRFNEIKDMRYANLQGATGLFGNEFAQADVTGTKLPDDIKEFKALEIVKETSQNARKIFFAMLLGCVYSWLTIATTSDVRLLTNTASSPLPIIGTEIPIAWFYLAAPLVLICLFFYFHLYLLKLWEGLSGLPAIFPDGKRLDERAYPWLLNGLVRRHFKILKKDRPFIAHEQEFITIFLAWWVVPITMVAFWLRFIPRHDWFGTTFHIILILVSVGFAIIFYRLCALTLKGKRKASINFKKFWSDKVFYHLIFRIILFSVFIFFVGLLFSWISVGAINGIRAEKNYKPELDEKLVPWAFYKIGYHVFADFREKEVSERPTNYWEIRKDERLESVTGANLKNRNLNNADMYDAFLVKANFRNAQLTRAFLVNSNLQKANLDHANIQQADLRGTNLNEANLNYANLKRAWLEEVSFINADLRNSKYLTIERLKKVKTLYKAKLDPELLEQVKKCCPHLLEKPKEETDQTK